MVPLLGSPLGWVPAVVYLSQTGAPTWQWAGMLVYGAVVISGIDNLVKPLLLRGSAQIHPLLGFLSIVGGLLAFGAFGFLVGPVVLSLVLSALRIYRLDILRGRTSPRLRPPERRHNFSLEPASGRRLRSKFLQFAAAFRPCAGLRTGGAAPPLVRPAPVSPGAGLPRRGGLA